MLHYEFSFKLRLTDYNRQIYILENRATRRFNDDYVRIYNTEICGDGNLIYSILYLLFLKKSLVRSTHLFIIHVEKFQQGRDGETYRVRLGDQNVMLGRFLHKE